MEIWGEWCPESVEASLPFPVFGPLYLHPLAVPSVFVITDDPVSEMFLSSVSKLIEPKEGIIGASHLQPVGQKPSDSLNWTLASEVGQGAALWDGALAYGSDAVSEQVV